VIATWVARFGDITLPTSNDLRSQRDFLTFVVILCHSLHSLHIAARAVVALLAARFAD